MAIGPVQLVVLGFDHPDFHSEIITELEKLRTSDTVRIIDALAVYKDPHGDIEVEHLSNLTTQEAIELGSKIGALIGLGLDGETDTHPRTTTGPQAATIGAQGIAGAQGIIGAQGIAGAKTPTDDAWDILADIPNGTSAALLLIEHHWAVPLRDAIAWTGGYRLSDGFISPLDLVAIGLTTAAQARALHKLETTR